MYNGIVYRIICRVSGKCYVGSSIEYNIRYDKHWDMLDKQKHHSIKLQYAYNKSDKSNFYFEIIERDILSVPVKELRDREQYWVDFYDAYHNGYNCSPYAHHGPGKKTKPLISYDLITKEIQEYASIRDAQRKYGKSIDKAVANNRLSSNKKLWFLKNEFSEESLRQKLYNWENDGTTTIEYLREKSRKAQLPKKNSRPVIRSDGKIYITMAAAARDLGVKTEAIQRVADGKKYRARCHGYGFKYCTEN